jgi:hypothetical protein
MLTYLDWLKKDGYHVRDTWSEEKKRMVGEGKLFLFPLQEKILGHALTFNEDGLLPYETIVYSTVKKSGKTSIAASVGAWYAEQWPAGTEIFCIANDLEAAEGRLMRDIKFHFQKRIE